MQRTKKKKDTIEREYIYMHIYYYQHHKIFNEAKVLSNKAKRKN